MGSGEDVCAACDQPAIGWCEVCGDVFCIDCGAEHTVIVHYMSLWSLSERDERAALGMLSEKASGGDGA